MKNFLKIIPIPICGLILALVSLGNLLKIGGLTIFGNTVGLIGIALMCLVIFKIIFTFKHTLLHMKNHIVASVAPTFTMALMVICTYFLEFELIQPHLSYIWLGIVFLQFVLMFYFTYFFLLKKQVKIHHVYPSWFITFVGIGVISITSSNFYPEFGRLIFWVAFSSYLVLLPIIVYRVVHVKNMEESTLPLITIIAAPGSLCLTGYLNAFDNENIFLLTFLVIVSQALYFAILTQLPKLLAIDFYPSYAAFTFPLVISAMALTTTAHFYIERGYTASLLHWISIAESVLAFIIVFYVLFKYIHYLMKQHAEARL
ncbi:TDT family transporter [Bacillus sp. AGMB 02131]|uniref:TDT family transporter n=1 Tax=Peribacillus faecalis TaxID=2772559 RepID=A0A927HBS8_9BACI|nr:TDT family transporter [Peribacillus faecalis]MBD3109284.1 TDT family transporter [Peribacillus faecalis]